MERSVIIFPGYFLPHVGGLETHVDEFVKYLSKNKNYNLTIFAPRVPTEAKEREIIHDGVKVIRYPAFEIIPNFPVPKFWSLEFLRLMRGLYKEDYDIVMTRTRFFINSFMGALFAKFRFKRKKLIHVEHGSDFVKLESKFKSFLAYLYDMVFGKLIFKISDKNVAISMAVKKFICGSFVNCSKEELPVIRRGVDFEFYKDIRASKEIKQRFENKLVMTYLGRLYKWKGVKNSIEAYKSLPVNIRRKVVFLVVGYGEDEERLKKLAGKYLDNGIYFLGERSFRDSVSILKGSDIYLHSAYPGGGLSNSLLQAMYCGNAVVASPHEGADEVITKENGILLRDNSPSELKKGIVKIYKDSVLRDSVGRNARSYIRKHLSWDKVLEKYEKVFNEV